MKDIVYSVKKLLSSVDAIKPIAYGVQNHTVMPMLCDSDLAACDIADPLIRTDSSTTEHCISAPADMLEMPSKK